MTKTIGLTLAAPISLLGAAGGLALALLYWRYLGILGAGAEPLGSLERQAYDALRASLATGGLPVRLYSLWLSGFLDAVDRFFGDAGKGNRTLFPRAFWLKMPAPLWTAPAFDRCLLLALIYPIFTIFVIWAVTGHVGPAEEALNLPPDLPGERRGLFIAAVGFTAFAMRRYARTKGWKSLIWLIVAAAVDAGVASAASGTFGFLITIAFFIAASFVAFAVAGAAAGAVAVGFPAADAVIVAFGVAGGVAAAFAFAGAFTVATGGSGITIGAFVVAIAIAGSVTGSGAVAVAVTVAVAFIMAVANTVDRAIAPASMAPYVLTFVLVVAVPVAVAFAVAVLRDVSARNRRQEIFLLVLLGAMTIACLVSASFLSYLRDWEISGPLLLFLGLLTLLNAPFDWASLGLTRALLRRGLELGGWWPYLLALLDALLAGVIIAVLALTMVIGVQAFDALAVHGGGYAILPLTPLFDGLAAHPEAPEYWWIYALLLSTTIPSLVNLVIGGTALTRTAPGLPSLLLQKIPAGRAVPAFDRAWVALVLTLQVVGGVILGVAAQALLAVGLIRYVMPWLGLGLLDLARAVAAFDLPARVGALL